uniref:Eukaryotic translation initiation factor 4B n=1 Tax=Pavo cristatus TaxID=9049 RepID=A0A8C9FG69_PAVCR
MLVQHTRSSGAPRVAQGATLHKGVAVCCTRSGGAQGVVVPCTRTCMARGGDCALHVGWWCMGGCDGALHEDLHCTGMSGHTLHRGWWHTGGGGTHTFRRTSHVPAAHGFITVHRTRASEARRGGPPAPVAQGQRVHCTKGSVARGLGHAHTHAHASPHRPRARRTRGIAHFPLPPPPGFPAPRPAGSGRGSGDHVTAPSGPFALSLPLAKMAASAAKKKNKKGKTLTLTDFLAEDGGSGAPTYIPKPVSWADETDDLDGDGRVSTAWHSNDDDVYRAPLIDRSLLPTAPRAAREPNIDRSRLPKCPPYTAFLGNLPYDVTEDSIKDFFRGLNISAVRLPREPTNPERLKGFGYAEFEDIDSLFQALSLNEEVS